MLSKSLVCKPASRRPQACRSSRKMCVRVCAQQDAANWDPDGLFGPPQTGHIARRMMEKTMVTDSSFAAAVQRIQDETEKEVLLRRATRTIPDEPEELIEYLLNTISEDMEYEVVRCRPKLTVEFFDYLDKVTGQLRFSEKPDEETLAEMDALRKYLTASVKVVDVAVSKTANAVDRVKKLLQAPDKKKMILQMAEKNEIDQGLLILLKQNINAARDAGMEEPAVFMEKIMVAASKYLTPVSESSKAAKPLPPPPSKSSLIL